jgi:hypothetical protein
MEQFDYSAWSLYTGPSELKTIINDPSCSWVVGQWDGINANSSKEEIKKDIDYRIQIIIDNLKQIIPQFKTYNRHFVIPEFFFHCVEGPYPNIKVDGENYPFEYIVLSLKKELKALIPNDNNYYTIIIGSTLTSNIEDYASFLNSDAVLQRQAELNAILPKGIHNLCKAHDNYKWKRSLDFKLSENKDLDLLNSFMKSARSNPLCTVRNRGAYFHFNKTMMEDVEVFLYEKQNESTVDLTMGIFDSNGKITTNGMITEWLGNYPSYSILSGDKQTSTPSTYARFTPSFFGSSDIGVEICLDHRLQRLRRTVDMSIVNGAAADNYPLFKQFIPSGGMQILDYSVAATKNAYIFNADGCDKIYTDYTDPNSVILNGESGKFKGITCGVYNQSIQSKWTGRDTQTYYSHSQIASTTNESSIEGFNNALGLNNIMATTYNGSEQAPSNARTDSFNPTIFPTEITENVFALNEGEIHYYNPE